MIPIRSRPGRFDLRIEAKALGEIDLLELHGRLDAPLERDLVRAIRARAAEGRMRVVVDCGGLDYLSSRGVSAFIAVIDLLRGAGGDLKLAAVRPEAALVLDRLGVSKFLQRFATAGEAHDAFRVPIDEFLSEGGLDVFLAGQTGRVFHASGCASVARIRTAVTYPSKRAAREAGLKPCRRCLREGPASVAPALLGPHAVLKGAKG